MRIRSVKPAMWESEKVGKMTVLARLTFLGLISLADDAGRGRGAPAFIRARLHAYAGDVDDGILAKALSEIRAAGLATFYEIDGCAYYELPGWSEHQRIDRPSPSAIPENNDSARTRRTFAEPSLLEGKGRDMDGKGEEGKKKATPPVAIPPDLEVSRKEIEDWLAYKREKGQTYKGTKGLEALWRVIRAIPVGQRRAAVDHSMANNYSGLFPPKGGTNGKQPTNGFRDDARNGRAPENPAAVTL